MPSENECRPYTNLAPLSINLNFTMSTSNNTPLVCSVALAFLLSLLITGCDGVLEEEPPSSLSPENFYQSAADAQTALTGAYSLLQSGYTPHSSYPSGRWYRAVNDITGPQMTTFKGPGGQEEGPLDKWNFKASQTPLEFIYENAYIAINGANAVLDNVPSIDMDEGQKEQILGEARFLRSLQYFMLVRLYGGVPIRDSEIDNVADSNIPRSTSDDVYRFVIEDLEQAIESLPDAGTEEYGRATREAAQTLLAKVHLQRGSADTCNMCGTRGATPESGDYQRALDLLNAVESSGAYGLVDNYEDLFRLETERNSEGIFVVRHRSEGGNGESIQNFWNPSNSGWFFGSFTQNWGEVPFYRSYAEEDVRREVSWVTEYEDNSGELRVYDMEDPENDNYSEAGPAGEKPLLRRGDIGGWAVNPLDTPILRYADVLLMKAEALNEINGGPNGEAYDLVDRVRNRAGLPDLNRDMDYDTFKDALFQEHQWEFAQEAKAWNHGQRFFERFTAAVEESAAQSEDLPDNAVPSASDLQIDLPRERTYPLPQSAIDQNPELEQYPEYGGDFQPGQGS